LLGKENQRHHAVLSCFFKGIATQNQEVPAIIHTEMVLNLAKIGDAPLQRITGNENITSRQELSGEEARIRTTVFFQRHYCPAI
jgi:hypothetical protein